MAVRTSEATWLGNLREGNGTMKIGSGGYEGAFTWDSRFQNGEGTNPEELLGAAHAGCFSMFLSAKLTGAGFPPTRIHTMAMVHLTDGPTISLIELSTEAEVPNVDEKTFEEQVQISKAQCPVSKALAAVELKVNAKLVR